MQPSSIPPPAPKKKMPRAIFLLAVLGGIVVIGGPCSVCAATSARKYVLKSKGAEARATLKEIAAAAARAIDRDGKPCPSASTPVPADVAKVRGHRYASHPQDWNVDADRKAGFACLGFSMHAPQHYQYDYRSGADDFTVTAIGDLDGNGVQSTFRMTGRVIAGSGTYSPNIEEVDAME